MYDRGVAYVQATGGSRYHLGVDTPVKAGTPLYGCGDGTVTRVSQTLRVGYIWIVGVTYQVAGLGTVYVETQHHSAIYVKVGDLVTVRTLLGLSGGARGAMGSGNSSGPHVHIQVRVNGTLADPDDYLNPRSALAGSDIDPFEEDDMTLTAEQDYRLKLIEQAIVSFPGNGKAISRLQVPGQGYDYLPAIINQNTALLQAVQALAAATPDVDEHALATELAQLIPAPADAATLAKDLAPLIVSALGADIATDADLAAVKSEILAAIAGVDEATLATFGLQRREG